MKNSHAIKADNSLALKYDCFKWLLVLYLQNFSIDEFPLIMDGWEHVEIGWFIIFLPDPIILSSVFQKFIVALRLRVIFRLGFGFVEAVGIELKILEMQIVVRWLPLHLLFDVLLYFDFDHLFLSPFFVLFFAMIEVGSIAQFIEELFDQLVYIEEVYFSAADFQFLKDAPQ